MKNKYLTAVCIIGIAFGTYTLVFGREQEILYTINILVGVVALAAILISVRRWRK